MNCTIRVFIFFHFWTLHNKICHYSSASKNENSVNIVEYCPGTQKEWMYASDRKKCRKTIIGTLTEEYSVYHCLPNYDSGELVEVCALPRNIVFGYCAEYSFFNERVQENVGVNCKTFHTNPCPDHYLSNEIYRYQGCYEMKKKTYPNNEQLSSTMTPRNVSTNESDQDRRKNIAPGIFYSMVVCVMLIIILTIVNYIWKKNGKRRDDIYCDEGTKLLIEEDKFLPDEDERIRNNVGRAETLQIANRDEIRSVHNELLTRRTYGTQSITFVLLKQPTQFSLRAKLETFLTQGLISLITLRGPGQRSARNTIVPTGTVQTRFLIKKIIESWLLYTKDNKGIPNQKIMFRSSYAFCYCLVNLCGSSNFDRTDINLQVEDLILNTNSM